MSHIIDRAELVVPAQVPAGVREQASRVPGLVGTAVLTGLAVLLALRWWDRGTATPASWQLPSPEVLFLVPAAPVAGLLALRVLLGDRAPGADGAHLVRTASRWAWVWAAGTLGWLVLTVTDLYGGTLRQVLRADNLLAVTSASDAVQGQLTLLWVALLVALFGERVGSWRPALGLLVLTAAGLLGAVPVSTTITHGHDATGHPAVQVAAALQLLAALVWLGALVAVAHRRTSAGSPRSYLLLTGRLLTTATVAIGASAVVAGVLLPAASTPVALAVGQLAAVVLVAVVGHRHRERTAEVVAPGRGLLVAALVGSEVVVLGAVVMLSFVLPLAR